MRISFSLLALGVACAQAWAADVAHFRVSGLPLEPARAELLSVKWEKQGGIELNSQSPNAERLEVKIEGLRLSDLPWDRFDRIEVEPFVLPDGPQYLVRFLGAEARLSGLIGLNQRARTRILDWWVLTPTGGSTANLVGQDGKKLAVVLGKPRVLRQNGLTWVFVLRNLNVSALAGPKAKGRKALSPASKSSGSNTVDPSAHPGTSDESPPLAFDYTAYRQ
jgi:hypothetical protein